MSHHWQNNGEWMMRASRAAQRPWTPGEPIIQKRSTPSERPEPEDTTGLKMLDEFLAKRKRER